MFTDWKKPPREKKKAKPLSRIPKNHGELKAFKIKYSIVRGKSEVTGKTLPFDIKNFIHVLGKGTRPDLRLHPMNLVHAEFEVHHLYDNDTREKTLKKYPNAAFIYDLKEKLKSIPIEKR